MIFKLQQNLEFEEYKKRNVSDGKNVLESARKYFN